MQFDGFFSYILTYICCVVCIEILYICVFSSLFLLRSTICCRICCIVLNSTNTIMADAEISSKTVWRGLEPPDLEVGEVASVRKKRSFWNRVRKVARRFSRIDMHQFLYSIAGVLAVLFMLYEFLRFGGIDLLDVISSEEQIAARLRMQEQIEEAEQVKLQEFTEYRRTHPCRGDGCRSPPLTEYQKGIAELVVYFFISDYLFKSPERMQWESESSAQREARGEESESGLSDVVDYICDMFNEIILTNPLIWIGKRAAGMMLFFSGRVTFCYVLASVEHLIPTPEKHPPAFFMRMRRFLN